MTKLLRERHLRDVENIKRETRKNPRKNGPLKKNLRIKNPQKNGPWQNGPRRNGILEIFFDSLFLYLNINEFYLSKMGLL